MVLVIGATGFLGPHVLGKLLENNYRVNCLVRTDSNKSGLEKVSRSPGKEVKFSTGTLQSGDSIISAVKDADAIIYMVDLKHTQLLKNFLGAVNRTGTKRVVFISSTTVLIPIEDKIKEKKINSEKLIKKSKLDYTILRPSMIYGCPDDTNFSKMIRFIKKRGFFITFGSGDNLIQPIYVGDAAYAAASVLENKKTYGKTYNLAGQKPLKYNDMIKIVKSRIGKQFKVIKLPIGLSKSLISIYGKISKNLALTPEQIERMEIDKCYSYEEAKRDFGFSPISFENGIEKLIKELN